MWGMWKFCSKYACISWQASSQGDFLCVTGAESWWLQTAPLANWKQEIMRSFSTQVVSWGHHRVQTPCAKLGPTKSWAVSCFWRLSFVKAEVLMQRHRSRGYREGPWPCPHGSTRGTVGPPGLQGKKAETTQA